MYTLDTKGMNWIGRVFVWLLVTVLEQRTSHEPNSSRVPKQLQGISAFFYVSKKSGCYSQQAANIYQAANSQEHSQKQKSSNSSLQKFL